MGIRRFLSKLLILSLVLLLVAGAGGFFLFRYFDSPPAPGVAQIGTPEARGIEPEKGGDSLIVEVKPGESASAVGDRLEHAGLIRSSLLWNLFARLDSASIKAGYYRVTPPLGALEIWDLLVSGKQLLVRVTIPEGFTLRKTAELLEARGVLPAAGFLRAASDPSILAAYRVPSSTMEGYLYPDTYLLPLKYPAEKIVRKMADTFFDRLSEIAPKPIDSYTPEQIFERVVIASIVEREYRAVDEAALMAGVFFNRLSIKMALQSCATVEYVITEIQGKPHPEIIYNRDIAIKNPYNTYVYRGLPPGPISFPGEVALRAAFNPASSDFLYFRLVDAAAGRHYFSKTLDEHVKAGVLYTKRIRAGS